MVCTRLPPFPLTQF